MIIVFGGTIINFDSVDCAEAAGVRQLRRTLQETMPMYVPGICFYMRSGREIIKEASFNEVYDDESKAAEAAKKVIGDILKCATHDVKVVIVRNE